MNRFISHDGLAAGVFNRDFCTAQPVSTAWSTQLTNAPDLLELLCSRLENDFVNLRPNTRKAFTGKDVEICLQVKSLASRVYRFVCQSFVPAQEMPAAAMWHLLARHGLLRERLPQGLR